MSAEVNNVQATQQAQSAVSSATAASARTAESSSASSVQSAKTGGNKKQASVIQSVAKALEEQTGKDKKELVSSAIEQLNGVMETFNKGMRFDIFDDTGELYVKVVNRDTNEVIRTIPSEDMLELMARLSDAIGMLIDEEG